MGEDLEQQKRAENEVMRGVRDQELARILAMKPRERLERIVYPCNFAQSQTKFCGEALLLDANHPRLFELAKLGKHDMMKENLLFKILDNGMDDFEHEDGITEYNDVLWRATSHEIDEFQSKIVKVYIQSDDPAVGEGLEREEKQAKIKEHLKRIKMVWYFFKEKFPDWIMIDMNGNPLEEVSRQTEEKNN